MQRIVSVAALLLAGSAEAGHCLGTSLPDYCCIIGCDSQYANNANYFGVGTTPACGAGVLKLSDIFAIASSQGCSPLTEDSCSFGPNAYARNACSVEVALSAGAQGDPHLSLPHGGKADFRGQHKTLYNFLTAKDVSLNIMTELADFELHDSNATRHKNVHGSFITQAHVVARTNTGKIVRTSYYADKIGEKDIGWANGTVDSEPAFTMYLRGKKVVDDVELSMTYASLYVTTPEFEIKIQPKHFRLERNVVGLKHRLDVQVKPRVAEADFKLPPHGILGQGWDGDEKAIDGEQDAWPVSGEFTTYAQAKGAIEGVPSDYKMAKPFATDFKYSRFDAKSAAPRDVAKLVADGLLNTPKTVYGGGAVGSSENTEEKM